VRYSALSPLERKYFNAFTGLIAREHWMAKVGEEGSEQTGGNLAALWRSSFDEKQQGFCILSHLEISENRADQPEPVIVFRKTEATNTLANFRPGDIAVLYPAFEPSDTILQHQVIKCTIVELSHEFVKVHLRYQQFNLKPFDAQSLWHLEPDVMDTGFSAMYRSLFEWAGSLPQKRAVVLAQTPPAPPRPAQDLPGLSDFYRTLLTDEQQALFEQMVRSQDYFLLWGPPGTGKTSVMLRALSDWVLHQTEDNLLLLAYTNRAVDEICEALDSIGGNIRDCYLRIGSRFSTADAFQGQLLSTHTAQVENRAALRHLLEDRRIFVSTVSSFVQNDGLLKLKKFQRLVIDEASQILEPQLAGLLTRFDHFVLIGDHRQLPAVTTQRPALTVVEDADLHSIGLFDLRDSYFERLYRRCESQQWHYALGRLSRQGRMHADIMAFPNRHFYGNLLRTLSEDAQDMQHVALGYLLPSAFPHWAKGLVQKRVAFIKTTIEDERAGQKTNQQEARYVAELVRFFKNLWMQNHFEWSERTLGIITPWRAQIACIRQALSDADLSPDDLTVDTVERYQGGARDIILLSCCVNSAAQLNALVSLSNEGTDRKFNVALTRARHHVVVLGNADFLGNDERYRAFMEAYSLEEED
jgi:DNA replication ATP-dependent helicase Dna2